MQAIMRTKLKLSKNQKGMTLIELMAVVVILGILAAVAGAAVTGAFSSSKAKADATSIKIISDAAQRYIMDKNPSDGSTVTVAALVTAGYLESTPVAQEDSAKPKFKLTVTIGQNGAANTISVVTDATGN